MTTQQIVEALTLITEIQKDTASITVKIGSTYEGRVVHGCLIILDCPARVIEELQAEGYSLTLSNGELRVNHYRGA